MKGKSVTFRPTTAQRAALDRLAKATERPITWLLEKAIEAHLPILEVRYSRELKELEEKEIREGKRYPARADEGSLVEERPPSSALAAVEKAGIRSIKKFARERAARRQEGKP